MKIAIMQPYFFPYIGYFQLMNAVDEFIVYDNIEYTKKGWVNRNRILVNGKDDVISLPLKKDSDYLDIRYRYVADSWNTEKKKMLNKIREAYRKAPFSDSAYPVIENILTCNENNLFSFVHNSLKLVNDYIGVTTPLIVSSSILMDHTLKAEYKVLEICKQRNATTYINAIGGVDLYSKAHFEENGIDLKFIKTDPILYKQFSDEFIPWLSIIDIMMFNSQENIIKFLNSYTLL